MKKLCIILGALSMCISVAAANKITGKVTDGNKNQGVEYANVSLLTNDSTFITGAATDNNGNFQLKEVKDGDYILCIACIGYENSYLSIRNLKTNLQLGELPLSPSDVLLEGVTITASPVIKKTDRQIILPTEMQTKAASNGLTLLRNMQLARIIVNPIDNSITVSGGDNVQLRINGVEVTQAEVTAIRPADVIRIEYIDNPGARYGNAGAVLNYIVKRREAGGNISADLSNEMTSMGYGEHNLAAKYNFNKSEISTTAYWGRRDLKWTRETYESFRFPEVY
ncbi:MAG: carboxypeptidase-like regulatory domain-containing protein [Bacteroides sp.]|nr:carboxypeptidase-like regulatory domain-containing protein [Bacteroides sp.]